MGYSSYQSTIKKEYGRRKMNTRILFVVCVVFVLFCFFVAPEFCYIAQGTL